MLAEGATGQTHRGALMKQWHPAHVTLALAAVDVRDKLRTVDWNRLDATTARVLVWAIRRLSKGLKARTYRQCERQDGERDAA